MDQKIVDHLYHRTRIDAQITGTIILVAGMGVLALLMGDHFKPLQPGAEMWDYSRLVWVEAERGWVVERKLIEAGNFPPVTNHGNLEVREIQPISVSIIVVLGTFAVSYFLYASARRQTRLMNAVYANDPGKPYQRPWEQIRITFWALNVVLVFIMFYFIT
ncbi:MAG: hypothetical protein H6817_00080 [Phycisphaerales bacterium]|nr:hypothetical protein [Phycisphaerales bacterium]